MPAPPAPPPPPKPPLPPAPPAPPGSPRCHTRHRHRRRRRSRPLRPPRSRAGEPTTTAAAATTDATVKAGRSVGAAIATIGRAAGGSDFKIAAHTSGAAHATSPAATAETSSTLGKRKTALVPTATPDRLIG